MFPTFFLNMFESPTGAHFYYYMQCECCACAVNICVLTQQVRIGRGTTWQGWETNFLSLGPDVIRLTSIWLTTGPISQSYLGPVITSTCGSLPANHLQMGHSSETPPNVASFLVDGSRSGGLTYPLSLCRAHPGLRPVAEKSPSCPMWDSNPIRPPNFAHAALITRLRRSTFPTYLRLFPW